MSILTAVASKALHLPPFSFGKWTKFALGRPFCELIKAYTRAVSIPYSVALGLDWEAPATSGSRRRDRDYLKCDVTALKSGCLGKSNLTSAL